MRRRDFLIRSGGAAMAALPARGWAGRRSGPPVDQSSQSAIRDLEREIPRLMAAALVPGLSIAIVKDGRLFWRRAFGVKEAGTSKLVDHDTVFEAASTSKPLFAYHVMKLCEKGVLNLDTPLTRYTTDRFLKGDPKLDLITARHVLSHTTGLPNWRNKDDPFVVKFTPGEKWGYSGEGYSYLQSVVTHLLGKVDPTDCDRFEEGVEYCGTDIDEYMKANLLVPFGMTASGYLWTPTIEARVARGHDPDGKPSGANRKPSRPAASRYAMAGGLCTTPSDYAKFLIEVVDPKLADSYRLTKASLDEMLRPQIKRSEWTSWALGWEVDRTERGNFIRHGGGNPGYSCYVAASVVNKSGYVIMTNCENTGYYGVIKKLVTGDALAEFLGGKLHVE